MNRLRIATIAGSLSLSIYFFIVGAAAILTGPSTILSILIAPMSLLDDLFSVSFDRFTFGCDVLAVSSMWLTFICLIDLSLLISTIDIRHSVRSIIANSYTKRPLSGFRLM